jgi:hypothetical protein
MQFFCPITHELLKDPVRAEDGRTYDLKGIDAWFASCRQRNLDITSPCTCQIMGCEVQRDETVAASARKFKDKYAPESHGHVNAGASETQTSDTCLQSENQSQTLKTNTETQIPDKCLESGTQPQTWSPCELRCAIQDVPSILSLCRAFSILQPVRSILDKSLEGWQPPRIVVIGTFVLIVFTLFEFSGAFGTILAKDGNFRRSLVRGLVVLGLVFVLMSIWTSRANDGFLRRSF